MKLKTLAYLMTMLVIICLANCKTKKTVKKTTKAETKEEIKAETKTGKKTETKTATKTESKTEAKTETIKSATTNKNKDTPRGLDLRNHFGTPNIANQYGPQTDTIAQYVTANPDTFVPFLGGKNRQKILHTLDFHPYPGYEKPMWPENYKSGDYTNIAPSATHIINPEITGPKLQVGGEFQYPMATKVPTFYGTKKEYHPVNAWDKETGEIIQDTALISRPVYNYENRVSNVSRKFNNFYDLRDGTRITRDPQITNHGIDPPDNFNVAQRKATPITKNLKSLVKNFK